MRHKLFLQVLISQLWFEEKARNSLGTKYAMLLLDMVSEFLCSLYYRVVNKKLSIHVLTNELMSSKVVGLL